MSEPGQFFAAVVEKFHRIAREKNRPLHPWDEYPFSFLWERFHEEKVELIEAVQKTQTIEAVREELIDVGAFIMFLYLHLDGVEHFEDLIR